MRLWLGLAALCFSVVVMFLGRKFGIVLRDKTITTRDLDALEAVLATRRKCFDSTEKQQRSCPTNYYETLHDRRE